jgi:hypothetical protein
MGWLSLLCRKLSAGSYTDRTPEMGSGIGEIFWR